MKYTIVAVVSVSLFFNPCIASEEVEIKDENDKVSYSVGYQVGGDFRKQGVDLNPEALLNGIQDALSEKPPLMTPEEMRKTLVELKKRIAAEQREKRKLAADKTLGKGKAYLAENAKKGEVKVLPSGLQYRVSKAGTGRTPKATDTVTVHYRGTLIDGTEFDSSYKRNKPAKFRIDRIIAGWTEALQLMKEGAKWKLFISPDLGYGERGAGKIPPNSTLIFEVELISVN